MELETNMFMLERNIFMLEMSSLKTLVPTSSTHTHTHSYTVHVATSYFQTKLTCVYIEMIAIHRYMYILISKTRRYHTLILVSKYAVTLQIHTL